MRPTPAETIDGVVRILRETVAPAVADPHARTQLQQVMIVLGQMEANDPAAQLADVNERRARVLDRCRDWAEADAARTGHFTPITTTAPVGPAFDDQQSVDVAQRGVLETFILELRSWRRVQGSADSDDLLHLIGTHLGGTGEAAR
jgi:hypothetical protein